MVRKKKGIYRRTVVMKVNHGQRYGLKVAYEHTYTFC